MRQIQADGPGGRLLAQHNVDGVILHCRIEHLLHLAVQAVDLIHKQHVPFLEIVENGRHLAGLLNGRTAGDLHAHPHLIGNDSGQGSLAQAGRAVKQHVVQGLAPGPRSVDIDFQSGFQPFLTNIIL